MKQKILAYLSTPAGALKVLSVIGGACGILMVAKLIPGVSQSHSTEIIGLAALGFKVIDMIESAFGGPPSAAVPVVTQGPN